MKQYPIYKAFFLSFFSSSLYRDVYSNWKGLGFKYLLALSTVICILISANWLNTINKMDGRYYADLITKEFFEDPNLTFEENLNRILNIASQLPPINISDKTASTEPNEPIFITDPVTKADLAIIDTSGEYNSLEGTDAYFLLTKTRFITREKVGENVTYLSSLERDSSINETDLNNLLAILHQIPLITVTNGRASIEEETPYYIYGQNIGKVAIIDPNASVKALDDEQTNLLLTSDRIFFKNPLEKQIKELYISDINADTIYSSLETMILALQKALMWIIPLFVLPIFIITSFSFSVVMVILYALVAISFVRLFKMGDFEFEDVMRISAVASTPVIVMNVIIPNIFASQGVIYFLIAIGYIYFALSSQKNESGSINK